MVANTTSATIMKFFTKVKTITSVKGELHFERWAIFESSLCSLYLHRIHKADKDHLHSHPWNFVSLILKGSYLEEVESTDVFGEFQSEFRVKKPFKVAYTHKTWFHKIKEILKAPIYTLVFVWGGSFEGDKWHYRVGNKKIPFTEYREIKIAAKQAGLSIEDYLAARK